MTYILFVIFLNHTAQIGPFPNIVACENAAVQIVAVSRAPKPRTVCINLNQKAMHWNGKEIPK